jgi:hypothetical protein
MEVGQCSLGISKDSKNIVYKATSLKKTKLTQNSMLFLWTAAPTEVQETKD